MPNAKVLESKKAVVDALSGKIKEATSVVFVDYKGITVAQDTELRKQFREAGVDSLRKIPVDDERRYMQTVVKVSNSCVELSENDWDSFETSWDFKKHPLI